MKNNEIAGAINGLTEKVELLTRLYDGSPGLIERGNDMLVTELRNINSNLGDIAEAIRDLSQQIGSEK